MSTIVTRAGKGSPLSNTEVDANFTNLDTDKLEAGDALGTPASVTLTNATGLPTAGLVDNAVTDPKLRDSAGLSVMGRGANSTGDPADIVAGTNHQVLRRDGSSLAFGAVDLSSNQAVTGTLPVNQGGTGITSFGTGVAAFLGTPSSANLAAAITNETGTGALVFATSPTLVTPALGTPASGVVTNLTGTASININGTVGAATPAAGAFTTLSATSNIKSALNIVNSAVSIASLAEAQSYFVVTGNLGSISFNGTSIGLVSASGFATSASFFVGGFRKVLPKGWTGVISLTADANQVSLNTSVSIATSSDGVSFTAQATATTNGLLTYTETTPLAAAVFVRIQLNSSSGVAGVTQNFCRFANLLITNLFVEVNNTFSSGLNYPAVNTLSLNTDNTERLRITSAGNVGIGTSTPSSDFRTEIAGRLRVRASGFSVSGTLGDIVAVGKTASTDNNVFPSIGVVNRETTTESLSRVFLHASDGIVVSDIIADGLGTAAGLGSAGLALRTTTNHPLMFRTNNTERLRITSAGNVGIGTSAPTQKLTVNSGSSTTVATFTSTGSASFIGLANSGSSVFLGNDAATGSFVIQTPSGSFSTKLTLDNAGNLGLGTSTPLRFNTGGSGSARLLTVFQAGTDSANRGEIQIGNAGTASGTVTGNLLFGCGASDTTLSNLGSIAGVITAASTVSANGGLVFFASTAGVASEKARIDSDGLKFNGDTAAANALDDYEEGTWTPVIIGGTTAGTGTYVTQIGRYTKIGNTVRIYFAVAWSAHTGTGTTIVTGFPFSSNATGQTPFAVFTFAETFSANNVANGGLMSNGATQWEHFQVPVGGGNSSGIPINASPSPSAEIQVSGVYQTA